MLGPPVLVVHLTLLPLAEICTSLALPAKLLLLRHVGVSARYNVGVTHEEHVTALAAIGETHRMAARLLPVLTHVLLVTSTSERCNFVHSVTTSLLSPLTSL